MTRPISSSTTVFPNGASEPMRPPAEASNWIFTRTGQGGAIDMQDRAPPPGRADGTPPSKLNYMVMRNGRLVPENARPAARPTRIPAPTRPDSRELTALRHKGRSLLDKMDRTAHFHAGDSVPFRTHRGERASLTQDRDGGVTIATKGRPILNITADAYDRRNVHVLMRGPDDRMHAGRNLPSDYVAEAARLVDSALLDARP